MSRRRGGAGPRDALDARAVIEGKLAQGRVTVEQAIEAYEPHMIALGNKPKSYTETVRRLRRFFAPRLAVPLATVNATWCGARYDQIVDEMAVDSHRNILAECKTFARWAVGKGWLGASPLEEVRGKGRRRRGKPQLRIDEARRWLDVALSLAGEEREGAVAGAMALLMGMRASEITTRQARDVDDGGRLLWIPEAKTDAGRRTLEVPDVLVPFLVELAEGKRAEELLFGPHETAWVRYWAHRISDAAQVPYVCPHGLRGTHSSVAVEAGATSHLVAANLGHASPTVTEAVYARAESLQRGVQRRSLRVLVGGRQDVGARNDEEGVGAVTPAPSDDRPTPVDGVG